MAKAAYHHGNLRDALVEAAVELLETEGLAALSLRAVARRVGVSQTAPYRHFADKEALLAAVAAEGFRRQRETQSSHAENAASPSNYFRAMGRGYIAFGRAHPALLKLMFSPAIGDWSRFPELTESSKLNYEGLQKAVASALPEGSQVSVGVMAAAAWSLVHGLTVLMVDDQITAEGAGVADEAALIDQVLLMLGGPGKDLD